MPVFTVEVRLLFCSRKQLPKALSARDACLALNPTIQCDAHVLRLSEATALSLVSEYDLVVDCCDNVPTRYLINDACVLAGKPLVSGSAVGMEGQACVLLNEFQCHISTVHCQYSPLLSRVFVVLAQENPAQVTVYNYEAGPCYRCLYPKPPAAATVTSCADGGVLGVVPGIIGTMQALQAVKIVGQMKGMYRF